MVEALDLPIPRRPNPNSLYPRIKTSGALLYLQLKNQLLQQGTGHSEAPLRRDIGHESEMEIDPYGPITLTDAPSSHSHIGIEPGQVEPGKWTKSDLGRILLSGNPILSLVFTSAPQHISDASPDSMPWFMVARPEDLRPGSFVDQMYQRAARWHYRSPAAYEPVYFNEQGIADPDFSPLLQSIARAFKQASAPVHDEIIDLREL